MKSLLLVGSLVVGSAFFVLGCGAKPLMEPETQNRDAELLRKAKAGDAKAQFVLGGMYATGEGVPENNSEAVKWFRR